MRVLPDVFPRKHQVTSKSLLDAGVEFVAPAWTEGRAYTRSKAAEQRSQHRGIASQAGEYEVFVEGSFEYPGVRDSQDSARGFDVVGDPQTGFELLVGGEAIVEIRAQAHIERPVADVDRVLREESELLDVSVSVKGKQRAAARQIKRQQGGIEQGIQGGVRSIGIRSHVGLKASC